MASRSSLVVNARVHLPGSRGRSAVITNNVEYIATREGADRSLTPDDARRAELAERMGLVGYYAERPGSTALFGQDGAVALKDARKELEAADGAIATVVLSVRRDEADELRLACKEDWQRFCRQNLAPALSEAMGVPESSVRWLAAEHENHPSSKHVHVVAWSSDGSFDSLMARNRLERARSDLTGAALRPALAVEHEARDIARTRAVDAARAVPAEEIDVTLPPDGRISYAHLRRWHPDTAKAVDAALELAESKHPELKAANDAYRDSIERCAELKGLGGARRDRYVEDAMGELRSRQANAALRTVAPDRTAPPEKGARRTHRPKEGPATDRRRTRALEAEVRACVTGRDLEEAREAVRGRRPVPESCLRACPSYALSVAKAPIAVGGAVARALMADTGSKGGGRTLSDEVGRKAERILARALMSAISAALRGDAAGVVLAPAKTIVKGIFL
ncbi:hypothetical protein [Paratractidigestivibacter sp.]|uniref:hypothetical protein n=1 Tax=Paratractidigestivibacter sp. TaxID=2847316 RepID=UPI002AC9C46B|nr:hypothetical protein [Paratractidigestivibacter sp.]